MTIKINRNPFGKGFLISNMQLLFLLTLILGSCKSKSHYPGPLTPEESMKTFHFADDFKAEIFATEPLITDPVSMVFDEQGNAFVVDMPDANMPDSAKGKCRIILLKDRDGDGRADTAIVFADSLRDATSDLPWKGGLLITAAPNILYYKDTNGDGRADLKDTLFTGFFKDNDETQITSLCFGVDNWIYGNNEGQAGEVTSTLEPNAPPLTMGGADIRFRLDRNQFERTRGPGQFGQVIDDWGHRFFTQNTVHIQQVVIPLRYLQRNPYLNSKSAKVSAVDIYHDLLMYQLSATPYWRQVRSDERNKEYKEHHLDRVDYPRDHFSGASGGTFYGGDKFPKEYYGNIFTGDVSGNLVHRDILSVVDSTPFLVAKRGEQEKNKEFLASTDMWFRPTSFTVGPDGYLYVIDMYRQHIEAPGDVSDDGSDDLRAKMDFRAGNNMGRIYRIVPKNAGSYKKITPNLKNATSSDLVTELSNQNRWWRLTAQRLLLERQDKTVIPAVKDLFKQSKDARFRLHALYVLEGMDALDPAIIKAAMKDPSPGVRENAAILSERFPVCLSRLEEMINDPSMKVALQATLSLGQFKNNTAISALATVVEQHGQNLWFTTAVLSSEAGSGIELLKALEKGPFFAETAPWKSAFLETFSNVIGSRNQKEQIISLLENISQPSIANIAGWQRSIMKGLIEGLEKRKELDASLKVKLKSIEAELDDNIGKAVQDFKQLYFDYKKNKSFVNGK